MIPTFFITKLWRMPLTYLYLDTNVSLATMTEAFIVGLFLLTYVLVLHKMPSKKFLIVSFSVMNYVLTLLFNYLTQSLLGMVAISVTALFNYVSLRVLMIYLIAISVKEAKLINCLYPFPYLSLLVGNLLKVFVVNPYSQDFSSIIFVFLIIQGLGFLFVSGVDIEQLKKLCHDYSLQENGKKEAKKK